MWLRHTLRAKPWDEWGTKEKTGKLGRKEVRNNVAQRLRDDL